MNQIEKMTQLARDTLKLSRNTLLVNLRFMDRALSMLGMVCCPGGIIPDTGFPLGGGLAVTGKVVFFDPIWVLTRYRHEKEAIVRDYLHMVFHCVFHHAFVNTLIDQPRWDLACDIAAESAIEDLHLTSVAAQRSHAQQNLISRLKRDVKILSAEKIYAWLREQRYTDKQIADMREPFLADSHDIWYVPGEMGSANNNSGDNNSEDENEDQDNQQNDSSSDGGDPQNQNSDGLMDEQSGSGSSASLQQQWQDIAQHMQTDLETFSKDQGYGGGSMMQSLRAVTREKYDYSDFLRRFAVLGEAMKINDDEFDYIFYTYGMQLYKRMPLIEPLEYKEVKRIKEFVIAIDTSGSTSGDLVQTFLQKTYNILCQQETFFTKINLHVIQCDAQIQEDAKITSQEEFDEYLQTMQIRGLGGTDFRPVFEYVEQLRRDKEFTNLKGLIYFTDGYGDFPAQQPDYHTAFVFVDDEYNNPNVPAWAIKLVLQRDEV